MPNETTGQPESAEPGSFISSSSAGAKVESMYSDFFQETSDGKITVGSKARKSGLEVFTTVFGYIVPIAAVAVIIVSVHVFLRTKESASFAENYQFLCPYMNYGVDIPTEDRGCNTLASIKSTYDAKKTDLENELIKKLNEYIPIKITRKIIATSPEKAFIVDKFENKVRIDAILDAFEKVVTSAQYSLVKNIECKGISIKGDGTLSTNCSIYGKGIGLEDTNGNLGSSRIEAMNFVSILSNTPKSQFILKNPPTTLTSTKVTQEESKGVFTTVTNIPIEIKYVPFNVLQ